MKKIPPRQIFLAVLMLVMAFFVARQYLPAIELPTQGRLDRKLKELASRQRDLQVARKDYQLRLEQSRELQKLAAPYWQQGAGSRLDQEVNSEFTRLTRLAQLSGVAGSQKVDMGREKNGSNLQEVKLSVEFKGIAMKDLARLFTQMQNSGNGEKFRWEYCKITPNNPRNPNGINVSARFKVLALASDTMDFINMSDSQPAAPPAQDAATPRKLKPAAK
jgi:hypothetical protein